MVEERAQDLFLKFPEGLSDEEVRETAGARDHEEFHEKLEAMDDEQFAEFLRKLAELKKKKQDATVQYVEQERRST